MDDFEAWRDAYLVEIAKLGIAKGEAEAHMET